MNELKIRLDERNTDDVRKLSVISGNSATTIVNQIIRDRLRGKVLESLRIEKKVVITLDKNSKN